MNINDVKYTVQEMGNKSFDDQLKVNMVEIIGADGVLKNPATEAKQDDIIANQTDGSQKTQIVESDGSTVIDTFRDILEDYEFIDGIQDAEDADVFYVGKAKIDGTYLILKFVKSIYYPSKRGANIGNNATRTTYQTAWTNRETLTYDYIFNLTNL